MEKFDRTNHFHSADGQWIRTGHLLGSIGVDDSCKLLQELKFNLLTSLLDSVRSSQMFPRNHRDWLLDLSCSSSAMVSFPIMVHVNHLKLLLLWRKFSRLLQFGSEEIGLFKTLVIEWLHLDWSSPERHEIVDHISPFHFILPLCNRIHLVCVEFSQTLLFTTILAGKYTDFRLQIRQFPNRFWNFSLHGLMSPCWSWWPSHIWSSKTCSKA